MSARPKILIVDDEPANRDVLEQQLEELGYAFASASNGQDALEQISDDFRGVVVTDIRMSPMSGLELMKRALRTDPDLPVILVSAYGDIAMAVQAMRDGAHDFIERPIEDPERLRDMVSRAVKMRLLVLENRALRAELGSKSGIGARLIGDALPMVDLREAVAKIGSTDASVIVYGETGTGKELVARCLHDVSARRRRRFVPVNCGAIPDTMIESELFGHEAGAFTGASRRRIGRIEYANGGTLFLDEIESMPMNMQVKLLRTLQERVIERLGSNEHVPVDIRLVAAAKTDLKQAAERDAFREDLYFRLNVAEIRIPPLRERIEDVPLLLEFLVQEIAAVHNLDVPPPPAGNMDRLMTYDWPGNVRELRNFAERTVLGLHSGDPASALRGAGENGLGLNRRVEAFERVAIERCLRALHGNIQEACEALGVPRRTLNEKMRKYGIRRQDFLDD